MTAGRITLDGHDLRDVRLDSLRRLVGVAFEEPTLFSMSMRENLTLGRPDADDDEVRAALALAQADFAYDLPWGLATRVGEQGLSLSGGQRQRLALARAVLGRPTLLVLDDPLSALDVHTEALVEAALRRVLRDTTALLVVHRPSTVALADRVALLDGGRITAVGRHSELLATVPAYRAVLAAEPRRRRAWCAREPPAATSTAPTGGDGRPAAELSRWRGLATDPDADRSRAEDDSPEAVARLRGRSRALLRRPAPPAPAGHSARRWPCCSSRTPPRWPGRTWSCSASTGHRRRCGPATRVRWSAVAGAFAVAAVTEYAARRGFLTLLRPDRPGRPARPAPAGVRPLPAPVGRLPRALHLGPDGRPGSPATWTPSPNWSTAASTTWSLAALSVLSVAAILLWLDLPLAAVTLLAFPFLFWLSRWFARASARPTGAPGRRWPW